ncbi:MAG: NAD(P)-dependent alcohol dehydrogenase [Levilactobacillus sp.]|jgi:aryl-alcohol dehydrogenase|uniref:NAD(P)-dependent alcohol dehydrogenase n=1 Tax=Levilactobacillus sp. TaxID=2767919 RepID=UPI00258D5A81|nr:NAD(P)-dependent alcohol dehydrogenase [Levilactobacillus sp.]MCI1554383.1 NAD(P)-dependent alcohol dehydrogenase [Levilactobacillus sp.]MCI1598286.1 NAD(P)-dependent alcohol dehydrogenase [Levilactobacillus sp.]MCI1605333.1 NAD(P)-dependent alcohol dehydrogenase [Levilactobacillus sp.]
MAKEVQAAVVEKRNDPFVVKNVLVDDQPGPKEVLVHIVASGICHSDEAVRVGDAGDLPLPIVLGHEGAGIVEKVGSAVSGVAVGDHVVLSYAYDGTCDNCLAGQPASCEQWVPLNMGSGKRPNGQPVFTDKDDTTQGLGSMFNQASFSTTTLVQESNVTVVGKDVDLRKVGPLGCGFVTGSGTVFNTLKPEPNSTMAIFGTGAVGSAALMAAKISGCAQIISVDIVPERLAMSKEIGATATVNSKEVDAVAAIKELTGGKGVDYAVDTTGLSAVMKQAVDAMGINGVFAPLAVSQKELDLVPFNDLVATQKSVVGVLMGNAVPQIEIKKLISFWQKGLYPFDKLEKTFKFADINEADRASTSGEVIKPVLIMDEDYTV